MHGQTEDGLICPRCERSIAADQSYCGSCGTQVRNLCLHCAHRNSLEQDFCGGCGRLLTRRAAGATRSGARLGYTPRHLTDQVLFARSPLEGERKDVTVLFVDVHGSMELALGVDPEEWHRILDRFFAILTAGVHRFEGTINQYTGDGIMALFGAPIAYESHAQRACYAALHIAEQLHHYAQELRRTSSLDFAVRMGISSGEVVVGSIGDDLRMDYTAQGYTVGLAARIMSVAEAGKVYLTADTARRVDGFLELDDLGEFHLKGLPDPVRTFALRGPGPLRARFDAARVRGLSKFVGRQPELLDLGRALEDVIAGQGCVVGVVGGAGIGKSRLCHEFLSMCRLRGLRIDQARCVGHGASLPFMPVIELLRSYFDLDASESTEQARERLDARLRAVPGISELAHDRICELLKLRAAKEPHPDVRSELPPRNVFAALGAAVAAAIADRPRILLLEDLHWIDTGSDAFLSTLVDAVRTVPILLLLNFRPEHGVAWSGEAHYRSLRLEPLDAGASQQLLGDLLGEAAVSEDVKARIQERAGGNPFFLEELVRALVESPIGSSGLGVGLPASVRAVVAARIDRLSPRDKAVLQAAAVVGERLSDDLVARIVELPEPEFRDAWNNLVECELIREAVDDDACFQYPIVQEVAYHSQLSGRRERTHHRVAEALEVAGSDLQQHAPVLAHHWVQAGDLRRGAQWHARAARGLEGLDPRGAARHWQEVLALLEPLDEFPENSTLRAESCLKLVSLWDHAGLSSDRIARAFEQGRALLETNDDRASRLQLYRSYALRELVEGSALEANRWLGEAIQIADERGDPALSLVLRTWRALAELLSGNLSSALSAVEAISIETEGDVSRGARELGRAPVEELIQYVHPRDQSLTRGLSPYAVAQSIRGTALWRRGDLAGAERTFDRLLHLAVELRDPTLRAHAYHSRARVAIVRGDATQAERWARNGIELCEEAKLFHHAAHGYVELGRAQNVTGDHAGAIESLEHALRSARRDRLLLSVPEIQTELAIAYAGAGQSAHAVSLAQDAVGSACTRDLRLLECDALLALSRALLRFDAMHSRAEIEAGLAEVEKRARETGAWASFDPHVERVRGDLACALRDPAGARRHWDRAVVAHRAIGAVGAAERLEASYADRRAPRP